jgi:exodeoxyribonuclease VII large subunit
MGIRARYPSMHVVVAETRVQGAGAAVRIASALAALADHPAVDVVVIARGGGSFEDLLPFSDERVVRAVAACPVPVVSAVGHEQDTPLCDLAADVRASTPSAAARLVVPDAAELNAALERSRAGLERAVRRLLARNREQLERRAAQLRAAPRLLLERRRAVLDRAGVRLQALSPRATLARGYAIVRLGETAVRDSAAVSTGALLDVELAAGGLAVRVEDVRP